MADSGTAPRYRSEVIVLADEQAIAVEDEVGQAGGTAVLSECLLNPMKELSGELTAKELPGALVSSTPAAAQVVWEEELPGALVSSTPAAAQVVWEEELPGALVSSTPAAAQVVWEEELLQVGTLKEKNPLTIICLASASVVG